MNFKILIIGSFVLLGCMPYPHPGYQGGDQVDECNFSVGNRGKGFRWKELPVSITLHAQSMNDKAILSTVKVVDEMNQKWKQTTQTNQNLFDILGAIHYDSVMDIVGDNYNSIAIVDQKTNSSKSFQGKERHFLAPDRHGVTQVRAALVVREADILLNNDHYNFYYEEDAPLYSRKDSKEYTRQLASLSSTSSFKIKAIFTWFLNLFRKKPSREPSSSKIPRNLLDFESLISHELGHVLGLGHVNHADSIMKGKFRTGTTRRGLRDFDINSLLCGYAQ